MAHDNPADTETNTDTPDWSGEFLAEVEHRQVAAAAGRTAAAAARRHLDLIRDEIDTLDNVMDHLSGTPGNPEIGLYELLENDDVTGLKAGDVLLCEPYELNPGKLTVICRLTDGYDPQCNQYLRSVRPIPLMTGPGGFYEKIATARSAMLAAQPTGNQTQIEYRYRNSHGGWERCSAAVAANGQKLGWAVQQRVIGGWL
ncbi:hypothetical protein ACFV9C_42415 [Kribbella sp. NPDC059898]|uniref:hypothetical protein n=1 Tax=Kribbella sp. NPDC059898 TaxID=3346995 RepID=UPI00364D9BB9